MSIKDHEMIPLEELEVGEAYEIESRNLSIGIWDGKNFHGIRRKFGSAFMEQETHYDLDDRHGTAVAVRKLSPPAVDGFKKEETLAHIDLVWSAVNVGQTQCSECEKAFVEIDEALPVLRKVLS